MHDACTCVGSNCFSCMDLKANEFLVDGDGRVLVAITITVCLGSGSCVHTCCADFVGLVDMLVCRDLKANNFLVDGKGRALVADFGHATDNQPEHKELETGTFKVRGYKPRLFVCASPS